MPEDRIAVVAAHPDDEVLLAGGTLARHAAAGGEAAILILATGGTGRGSHKNYVAKLRDSARRAAKILGAGRIEFAGFPDNAMDTVPLLEVVQRVEAFVNDWQPCAIYTHHAGDLNIDHRIVHQAVLTACRPLPGAAVAEILAGEVNSSTEWAGTSEQAFVPNDFVDIGAALAIKIDALACYADEIRDWPHPRSRRGVEALAFWRGAQAGFEAAEAFMIARRLRTGGRGTRTRTLSGRASISRRTRTDQ